jgi:acyl-CoA thioesterase FadM
MTTNGWLETYRGTVFRWEVDNVDHFTVAYYFDRFGDASLTMLDALSLGPAYTRREDRTCLTAACYVRYHHELRVGDIMHVMSGVIRTGAGSLVLGHKLFDSGSGVLCATVEERVVHLDVDRRTLMSFTDVQRRAAEGRRIEWDGPPRERRTQPKGLDGFTQSARDTVKPREMDVHGQSAMSSYIHRFSAANAQHLAGFGMTPAYMRDAGRGFSTFEFQVKFMRGLRAGDAVSVKSALLHVGNSSMRVFHKMFDEATGDLVASLDQLGVHLDVAARRPTPLPDALRDKAKALAAATVA